MYIYIYNFTIYIAYGFYLVAAADNNVGRGAVELHVVEEVQVLQPRTVPHLSEGGMVPGLRPEFRVWGSGFGVEGLGFGVEGVGFGFKGLGFMNHD